MFSLDIYKIFIIEFLLKSIFKPLITFFFQGKSLMYNVGKRVSILLFIYFFFMNEFLYF